jgi:hypothetical protein
VKRLDAPGTNEDEGIRRPTQAVVYVNVLSVPDPLAAVTTGRRPARSDRCMLYALLLTRTPTIRRCHVSPQ